MFSNVIVKSIFFILLFFFNSMAQVKFLTFKKIRNQYGTRLILQMFVRIFQIDPRIDTN